MAQYVVADPSGQKHIINGPDGATPQQVIQQAQKVIPYQKKTQQFPQGQQQQPVAQSPQGGMQDPFNGIPPDQLMKALGTQGAAQLIQQRMALPKPSSPWKVVPNMLSKDGNPIQQNEMTGEVRSLPLNVQATGKGNALSGATGITWDTATPDQKALAKGIYDGNIRPYDLGYRDRSIGTMLANEYATRNNLPPFQSYSGDVKSHMANALASGKLGMNALSLNTALGHANSAMQAYQRVSNTNQRWLNIPINKIREQTNDPNIIKLQTTLTALNGELATVFKGSGGTDEEIGKWTTVLNDNLTPTQAVGAIQQVNELLRSRLSALQYQQSNVMNGRPGDRMLLSPHAAELQQEIGGESSNDDDAAMQWAKQNPNDPRAKRILQLNGL